MAERDLTAGALAAVQGTLVRPVLFFEGEYDVGTLRLHTGIGDVSWNGQTWTGAGDVLGVSEIRESRSLEAIGFSVRLSGLRTSILATTLGSMRKNKPGKLWLGFYDAAGALIADPYPVRRGRFDTAEISRDGDTATIELKYEDRLVDLERARERRWTFEDQQLRLAGDKGFNQVPELQDASDAWGESFGPASPFANTGPRAGRARR